MVANGLLGISHKLFHSDILNISFCSRLLVKKENNITRCKVCFNLRFSTYKQIRLLWVGACYIFLRQPAVARGCLCSNLINAPCVAAALASTAWEIIATSFWVCPLSLRRCALWQMSIVILTVFYLTSVALKVPSLHSKNFNCAVLSWFSFRVVDTQVKGASICIS